MLSISIAPLLCLAVDESVAEGIPADWAVEPSLLGGCECEDVGDCWPPMFVFAGEYEPLTYPFDSPDTEWELL